MKMRMTEVKLYTRGCSECVGTGLESYNPYTKESVPCKHCDEGIRQHLKNTLEEQPYTEEAKSYFRDLFENCEFVDVTNMSREEILKRFF
jgi:hypothetical protein